MRKILFSGVLLFLSSAFSWGQFTQNSLWSLPPKMMQFHGNLPPTPPTSLPVPVNNLNVNNGYGYSRLDAYRGDPARNTSNIISSPNGDLIAFVVDGVIYNKDGYALGGYTAIYDNGGYNFYNFFNDPYYAETSGGGNQTQLALTSEIEGTSEVCVIPDPTNCQRYHIIMQGYADYDLPDNSTGKYRAWGGAYYMLLDMSIPNTYNTVVPGLKGGLVDVSLPGQAPTDVRNLSFELNPYRSQASSARANDWICCTKPRTDGSMLVFVSEFNFLGRFRLDASGLNYEESIALQNCFPSGIANHITENGIFEDYGCEMEITERTNGDYRLAFKATDNSSGQTKNTVLVLELDNNGDVIPALSQSFDDFYWNANTVYSSVIKGLEFSPNGDRLYISHLKTTQNPNSIEYIDFTQTTPTVQPLLVTNAEDFQFSQIELGQDGKLYFVGENPSTPGTANRLATLGNPDAPTLPSDWTNSAQTISYKASIVDFPPNVYYLPHYYSKIYTLPDQIDGMDYAARFTQNLQCCIDSRQYDVTTNTYGGTDTWTTGTGNNPWNNTTGTVYVQDELRFAAGSNITIKNMTFKFAPGAHVIIERGNGSVKGAVLTMDGTTFTADNRCVADPMWLGVQVWGNASAAQIPVSATVQGQLYMKNSSMIELAQYGAMASKRSMPQTYPWVYFLNPYDFSYNGGIIICENSSFHNNLEDVQLQDYIAPAFFSGSSPGNRSKFTNCTFYTDGPAHLTYLGFTVGVNYHVELSNVSGVNFVGCDFKNDAFSYYTVSQRGIGIYSKNAKFSATQDCNFPCTNPDRGTFSNLYYGIYSSSYNGLRTLYADKCDFTNNLYGIYLNNNDVAYVTSCNFDIYASASPNLTLQTYGLFMTACTGYHVEANHFTQFNDPNVPAPTIGNTYGIIVDNSGTTHNEIYRNTFEKLKIGVQAQRINAPTGTLYDPTKAGLQIMCNHFVQDISYSDIAVTSGRIDYHQGYHGYLAGNLLTQTPGFNNEGDIYNRGEQFDYLFAINPLPPAANYHVPKYFTHSMTSNPLPYEVYLDDDPYSPNTCPSKLTYGVVVPAHPVPFLSQLLQHRTDSVTIIINQDQAKIDGGNTAALLNDIATQSPGNLKNELMQSSPYLSDTVLKSYLAVNPPNGHIKEVVVANSPVTAPVYQKIVDMNLPHGIQKQIDKAQTGISARRLLEDEIAYSEGQRIDYIYEHIRLFLFDSLSPNPMDSIALILKENGITDEMRKLLFDSYLDMPDTVQAIGQRQEVIAVGTCQHFSSLSSIKLNLLSATSVADAINSDAQMQSDLTSIANSGDVCCSSKAQCLLAMAHDTLYAAYIEDLAPSNTAIGMYNGSNSMNDDKAQSNLSIYPNPSDGGQHISVALVSTDETLDNSRVEVYSLTGQLVYQGSFEGKTKLVSFDAGMLHAGVYFVKLIQENAVIETKKLVVNR